MTKSSSLTQVSNFIAKINGEKPNTVRQRLKEWYQQASAKTGNKRCSLDVSSCFAPLMRWVISLLPLSMMKTLMFVRLWLRLWGNLVLILLLSWHLTTTKETKVLNTIFAIQEPCQFYNYTLSQPHRP